MVARDHSAEHLLIEQNVKFTGTRWSELSEDNVLRDTAAVIELT